MRFEGFKIEHRFCFQDGELKNYKKMLRSLPIRASSGIGFETILVEETIYCALIEFFSLFLGVPAIIFVFCLSYRSLHISADI